MDNGRRSEMSLLVNDEEPENENTGLLKKGSKTLQNLSIVILISYRICGFYSSGMYIIIKITKGGDTSPYYFWKTIWPGTVVALITGIIAAGDTVLGASDIVPYWKIKAVAWATLPPLLHIYFARFFVEFLRDTPTSHRLVELLQDLPSPKGTWTKLFIMVSNCVVSVLCIGLATFLFLKHVPVVIPIYTAAIIPPFFFLVSNSLSTYLLTVELLRSHQLQLKKETQRILDLSFEALQREEERESLLSDGTIDLRKQRYKLMEMMKKTSEQWSNRFAWYVFPSSALIIALLIATNFKLALPIAFWLPPIVIVLLLLPTIFYVGVSVLLQLEDSKFCSCLLGYCGRFPLYTKKSSHLLVELDSFVNYCKMSPMGMLVYGQLITPSILYTLGSTTVALFSYLFTTFVHWLKEDNIVYF